MCKKKKKTKQQQQQQQITYLSFSLNVILVLFFWALELS